MFSIIFNKNYKIVCIGNAFKNIFKDVPKTTLLSNIKYKVFQQRSLDDLEKYKMLENYFFFKSLNYTFLK